MKLGEGVEWGLGCCVMPARLDGEAVVSAVSAVWLAGASGLPVPCLDKRFQGLVRAGVPRSAPAPGARGGFRMARPLERSTLVGVVAVIEGPADAFRCAEIRRQGAGAEASGREFGGPDGISTVMRQGEPAWRRELGVRTIADVMAPTSAPTADRARRRPASERMPA
ncbi:Rrf2 family transcriptional regulator [Streptomyces kasugaensis]|uniref:Rrf2 family transcriptional regulator n=2 Tax=Streptomyces kasugaensis TaxID=1946 RepID=A0A4Q9HNM9_STRKA|nr:Rrf2 family transcriptional regulator [Streptomyces kasugaensis]